MQFTAFVVAVLASLAVASPVLEDRSSRVHMPIYKAEDVLSHWLTIDSVRTALCAPPTGFAVPAVAETYVIWPIRILPILKYRR